VLLSSTQAVAQPRTEVIERGTKATALVLISSPTGWTGSAFCIDKSGLFITNAHVVEKALDGETQLHLMVNSGLTTRQVLRAKVMRHDDKLDLALLQIDRSLTAQDLKDVGSTLRALAQPKEPLVLTPLELGTDAGLIELADVATIGAPFGPAPPSDMDKYPAVSVRPGHITSLRKDRGQLLGVQIDSQLNPGHSGGPVLDSSGKVIGMVATMVRGAALNLAIPVSRLNAFLAAPGLVFKPPAMSQEDGTRPVTWTIQLQPPMPQAKLPQGVSVAVTIADGPGKSRSFIAQPAGDGSFKVTLTPLPGEREKGVELQVRFGGRGPNFRLRTRDKEITVGSTKLKLSELRLIFGGVSPRVETTGGKTIGGPIQGLGTARTRAGQQTATLDLRDAAQISVRTFDAPVQEVVALVEAKQGTKVLASIRKRAKFDAAPARVAGANPTVATPRPVPARSRPSGDDGVNKIGPMLDVDGIPRGAGKTIQPPSIAIPVARLTPENRPAAEPPLVCRTEGAITDVVVGGAGRFLLLTLHDARKLAVFDINAADIVKTIPLPSSNVLVTAGAKKFLIVLPDEKRLEHWDLTTMERDGDSVPFPFDGQLKVLALGSDSDGPALVLWSNPARLFGPSTLRCSFLDVGTLTVLKVNAAVLGGSQQPFYVSTSGGSFGLDSFLTERPHLRASAGGGLFGIWQSHGTPSWFFTLAVQGQAIGKSAAQQHFGYVVPGPDGHTVFTCAGGRLDAQGWFLGRAEPLGFQQWPELTLPSADPSYYLSIGGLPSITANNTFGKSHAVVTVSVHAAGDGARLLTVHGLDEMAGADRSESFLKDDFTVDKRFYFVPAAGLLITIPPENDRLVVRRLNLEEAIDGSGGNPLIVTSPPSLLATAGQALEHQVVARSKKGGITFTLTNGPNGLKLAPDGKLTWTVPQRLKDDEVMAVVTASDASGQEIFQSIRIHVKGAGAVTPRPAPPPVPVFGQPPIDDGLLAMGATLNVDGAPRGTAKDIQPSRITIPAARLTPQATDAPLVRPLDGRIGDIAIGGGGRYLLLALKEARKLAVFDVNAADVVKTIPLPSPNALIAAGAKSLLIAFPEEKLIQRWDLATLRRDEAGHASPIDGQIRGLALGSDSDGPALVLWSTGRLGSGPGYQARFSFLDLDSLKVMKVGSTDWGKRSSKLRNNLSGSGGSFVLDQYLGNSRSVRSYLRASAGGALFGIWSSTMGCYTLQARGNAVVASYLHSEYGHFAPGPDGRTVFTGLGIRLDVDGQPVGRVEPYDARKPRELAFPSSEPSYYLIVGGLPGVTYEPHRQGSQPGAVTASVHAAGDGSRLLTVHGLDEMTGTVKMEDWFPDGVTTDQRFHFVPAAHLLITIPPSNDRLVLRRLDLDEALGRTGGDHLIVTSPPTLDATAGEKLVHRIVARSKKGGITYALARGPDGLKVASDGRITWTVPRALEGQDVTVVVTVGDASGDELFHTLKIRVK